VNSFNVWNYAEGHDSYYASMLVDLTLSPGEVCIDFSLKTSCCCAVCVYF